MNTDQVQNGPWMNLILIQMIPVKTLLPNVFNTHFNIILLVKQGSHLDVLNIYAYVPKTGREEVGWDSLLFRLDTCTNASRTHRISYPN